MQNPGGGSFGESFGRSRRIGISSSLVSVWSLGESLGGSRRIGISRAQDIIIFKIRKESVTQMIKRGGFTRPDYSILQGIPC